MNAKSVIGAACTVAVLSAMAPAANASTKLSHQDSSFVDGVTQVNDYEIELGRYAAAHGVDPKVRAFGRQMVADHTNANQTLQAIAAKDGFNLPTKISIGMRLNEDRIKAYKGHSFDQAYLKDMIAGHTGAIKDFKKELAHGKNPDVIAFATNVLPTVRHHLTMAQMDLK